MTYPPLTADLIERPTPPPVDVAPPEEVPTEAEWRTVLTLTTADLRFFAICYLAGLIFFLVMLS